MRDRRWLSGKATPKDYSKRGVEGMPKVAGLVRQGSRYFYRRGVPKALRDSVGKSEIWITLDTSEWATAAKRAREAAVAADQLLERARASGASGIATVPIGHDGPSEDDLQRVAIQDLWRREVEAGRRPAVPAGLERDDWQRELEDELASMERQEPGALATVAARASRAAQENHLPAVWSAGRRVAGDALPEGLSRLIELLRRSEVESLRRALDRLDGGHGDATHDPLFANVSALSSPVAVAAVKPLTLGDAIDRFGKDPTRAHLGDTADAKFVVTFRAMREVIGDARPLETITRAECAAVQEVIAGMPANAAKLSAYAKCKTLRMTVELARERGDRLMSPGTVRVYTHTLSAFFNWAIRKGLVSVNPATRLAPAKGVAETSRRPFSVPELNAIVAGLPAWAGEGRSGRRWVPLVAIFSGMRLGEIVTLSASDVAVVDGVHAFVLRKDSERSLKTAGSERVVPLHPELVKLGLLKHVETVREAGGSRLFMDLPGKDQAQIADLFQKRFSYLQRTTLKIEAPGVSFHSFRHGFRDALREAGVPIDATRALGGWARSGGVEERYGQGTRPATLARWMAEVRFEGLDLSPIRPSSPDAS